MTKKCEQYRVEYKSQLGTAQCVIEPPGSHSKAADIWFRHCPVALFGSKRAYHWRVLVCVAILLAGVHIRLSGLTARPLWVDEAESSINGLTILDHGVPVDHYLGLPIYENTLVERWDDSKEYEFRDASYSRHLAVYHGWLPLYAIAAALKLFRITPDYVTATLKVRYDTSQRLMRTWVPRLPSVIFGLFGMVALFFAAGALGGPEAGWAALIAGALAVPRIEIDQQARYYAATVALDTICCLICLAHICAPHLG